MSEINKNDNLNRAKKAKEDEFFTQYNDIEKELIHYVSHFEGKTIYCNCDNPKYSNFYKYFKDNFSKFKIKKLIATFYNEKEEVYETIFDGINESKYTLNGNGDFASNECISILKESDIVITNPPFSLFREFVKILMEYEKKFVIIGSLNALKYKEIFPYVKENKLWLGYKNGDMEFRVPDYYEKRETRYREDEFGKKWRSLGNICWYTNLDIEKRHNDIILTSKYDPSIFPKYDNYDAINVNKVKDIPFDYDGIMGVPITFVDKYNPSQFEIIGELNHGCDNEYDFAKPIINGKELFPRILVKKKS